MPGVWQGVLPVTHVSRAQDPPFGGVAAQVPGVQPQLQPAVQPEDAPSDAHRHQAVQLSDVQQGLPAELRPPPTQSHTQPVSGDGSGVRRDDGVSCRRNWPRRRLAATVDLIEHATLSRLRLFSDSYHSQSLPISILTLDCPADAL